MKKGKSYFEDVFLWHREMDFQVRGRPATWFDEREVKEGAYEAGFTLIKEEFEELLEAFEERNNLELADAGADLVWVVCGLMARLGIDLDAAWDEVRRTNWAKADGPRRADGKILKPEGWEPPDMTVALNSRNLVDEIIDGIRQCVRASGDVECDICGDTYYHHPSDMKQLDGDGRPYLRVACDGTRLKL